MPNPENFKSKDSELLPSVTTEENKKNEDRIKIEGILSDPKNTPTLSADTIGRIKSSYENWGLTAIGAIDMIKKAQIESFKAQERRNDPKPQSSPDLSMV